MKIRAYSNLNSIFLGKVKQLSNRRLNGQCNCHLKCLSLVNRSYLCILTLGYHFVECVSVFVAFRFRKMKLK